ncbi:hypothetical protein POF50_019655 [Streptomyces sp. SL13]|uniref:Uncharacterized protein n=1 Tax=Streptantibioticus silvisoli TaxID=2705255 RepID=A0AA90K9R1_9ACTN|nr:hypothetical protein [Streptantibioticus silvisoli]MDI5971518.1 hypothetical protein [Streptantibioticus silvisoli]
MNRTSVLFVQRVRLLAMLAGLAWLLGVMPSVPVRLLAIVLVVIASALDTVSDRASIATPAAAAKGRQR